jgi:hypothetical protein
MNNFLRRLQRRYYSVTASNLQVFLGAGKNLDHPKDKGAAIKGHKVAVKSLEDAQKVVRKFIDDNDLGAGNWYAVKDTGWVFDGSKKIARIAYNGSIQDT